VPWIDILQERRYISRESLILIALTSQGCASGARERPSVTTECQIPASNYRKLGTAIYRKKSVASEYFMGAYDRQRPEL
jgi:hypothetical protein